jgi:hypothetical protein
MLRPSCVYRPEKPGHSQNVQADLRAYRHQAGSQPPDHTVWGFSLSEGQEVFGEYSVGLVFVADKPLTCKNRRYAPCPGRLAGSISADSRQKTFTSV